MTVKIQKENFNVAKEIEKLTSKISNYGSLVSFLGNVRKVSNGNNIISLNIEHYPGMTEKQLQKIQKTAVKKWKLEECLIIHRYGELLPKDNIVLVLTVSKHRKAAYEASMYIIEEIKTKGTFWKLEKTLTNETWVEQN
tara:strand:- start:74 stop:490 length:417 start_codon:yes stop_codon:yes gene_type:complete